jgi:hypothetical protein
MKFDNKMLLIIFVAALFLIWYIIHPFIIEGAISAASAETKLKVMSDSLRADKFNKPTNDPVILGQKLELLKQRRDLLTEILKDPKFVKPKSKKIADDKTAYQQLLKETGDAIPPLETQKASAQAALDASRQKKR